MAEKSPNLLLSNLSAPADGINKANVLPWYGGPLMVSATGTFAGARVTLMACVRLPLSGLASEYSDPAKFTDADWTEVASTDSPGNISLPNLNPCALAVKVSTPAASTRIKVQVL